MIIQFLVALGPLYLMAYSLHLLASRSTVLGFGILLISSASLVLVLNPKIATTAANLLGVGRGADLLLYVVSVSVTFLFISTLVRIRNSERQITFLVREIAIQGAIKK